MSERSSRSGLKGHRSPMVSSVRTNSDDRRYLSSTTSSVGSATLCGDSTSGRTMISAPSNQTQFRGFASHVGKIGEAERKRKQASHAVTQVNPLRQPPISTPIDYEKFLAEKSAQLESDCHRDLLLFPRDDIAQTSIVPEDRTTIPTVSRSHLEAAQWLFTREALQLYSDAFNVIAFNYVEYAGDFRKIESPALGSLRFESDLLAEEKASVFSEEKTSEIIREEFVTVLPGDSSFVDNFRGEKRRYCVVRRDEQGGVFVELRKQPNQPCVQAPIEIKKPVGGQRKNRQVVLFYSVVEPDVSDKAALVIAPESDITPWVLEIDRALAFSSNLRDDSQSIGDAKDGSAGTSRSAADTESIASDGSSGSLRDASGAHIWRGKNAVGRVLQPPVIERRNLFSLYSDLEPLPPPRGQPSSLFCKTPSSSVNRSLVNTNRDSSFCYPSSSLTDDHRSDPNSTIMSLPDDRRGERHPVKLTVELRNLSCCVTMAPKPSLEQVEPFFVRIFLFDVVNCQRLTEEFKTSVVPLCLRRIFNDGLAARCTPVGSPIATESSLSINDIPYDILMHPEANRFVCALASSKDVFVVVRVERLLSDISGDLYGKTLDAKQATKVQKTALMASQKLARFRNPFAWTACPVFPSVSKPGFVASNGAGLQLFRCEGRLTDLDLQRYLFDCAKTEKSGKLTPIPNGTVSISVKDVQSFSTIPYRISPSLLPLKPWKPVEDDVPAMPVFELQSFGDVVLRPFHELVNLLYVYPTSLSYGGQKAFNRARNISCSVRFVSSIRRDGSNAKAVVDRSNCCGPMHVSANTAVQYHEQNPAFNDEIKVRLPVVVDSTDHLLFSFTHVSVSTALAPKSEKETVETPVGFAWLPLTRTENFLILSDDVQEFDLPVAASLPTGYIHHQAHASGKNTGPDIKWLDNGRPLFRVRLRLVSSVFTTEDNLQAFFQACQRLYDLRANTTNGNAKESLSNMNHCSTPDTSEFNTSLASDQSISEDKLFEKIAERAAKLYEVDTNRLIPHFPVVLRRLLTLLPICSTTEVALQILSVTIGIIDCADTAGFNDILHEFVRFHFSLNVEDDETTHGALCRHLVKLLNNIRTEQRAVSRIFRQLWFLLDVVVKSMTQWLIETKKFKAARRDRFPADFLFRVESLVDVVVELIAKNHSLPEVITASTALANFLRACLSLTDRSTIFNQIHLVVEMFDRHSTDDSANPRLRSLKLAFLQILCAHEHLIPLSLPLLTDRFNVMLHTVLPGTFTDIQANTGFLSRFFALFASPSANPTPSAADGALSDRFDNCSEHFWLSPAYCRTHFLTGLLIQELFISLRESRGYRPLVIGLVRNLLAKHSVDFRYADKVAQGRIAILYMPVLQFAIDNIKELEVTARAVSDTSELVANGVTWNALAAAYDSSMTKGRQHAGNDAGVRRSGVETTVVSALTEKLTKAEARDILVSAMFILSRAPKRTLPNVWLIQEQKGNVDGLVDFLKLLDLALQLFSYPGRACLLKQQAKRRTMLAKASVNFQVDQGRSSIAFSDGQTRGTLDSQNSSTVASMSTTDSPSLIELGEDFEGSTTPLAFFKECNLTQEVSITVLDIAQSVSGELAVRCNNITSPSTDAAFHRLLLLYIRLLDESWPETIRLNALAALSIFVSHFSSRFFYAGPMEPLSLIIEAMLLQLNSHFQKIQQAAAALLQAILRKGYEVFLEQRAKQSHAEGGISGRTASKGPSLNIRNFGIDVLGRPGSQTSVALARLLGQRMPLATSAFFDRGLSALESLIASQANEKRLSPFEGAVMELIGQLRGVLSATGALAEAADNPIRLAELHIQLADSYRGSARLRCTWFDTLAQTHVNEKWYSEAAVCQAHSVAIIAKELTARGLIKVDWTLFDVVNDRIATEENVFATELDTTQQAGFTLDSLTSMVEATVQTLILAERYEAVGPICRLAIPIYEKLNDYKSLVSIYVDLQQASSRAAEIKAGGKRRFGAYFRVVFHSETFFRDEDKTEWIYREPGLTSLAEACERMVVATQHALGTDRVQVLPENKIDYKTLKNDTAYIQMTHVEPCLRLPDLDSTAESVDTLIEQPLQPVNPHTPSGDPMNFFLHTNVRNFFSEERLMDETVPAETPEQARVCLKRVYLTVEEPFPNTRRRQRVVSRQNVVLNPLELACDSLRQKASQIRRFLAAAGIPPRCAVIGVDSSAIAKLDLKGLQCFLQGAVSPTVNAGVLAYAEAFTLSAQKERYGADGMEKLVTAFKVLMTELHDALEVNGKAIGSDQHEYQEMLEKSFSGMLERLKDFFGEQEFILKHVAVNNDSYDAAYVLNSIGGVDV